MDAIKLIGTAKNGKLIVDIPQEFNNKELEIMIVSAKEIKDVNSDGEEENHPGENSAENTKQTVTRITGDKM